MHIIKDEEKIRENILREISLIACEIKTRERAVYFLVLLRKLLEIPDKSDDYPNLKFFTDWCLHRSLTFNKTFVNLKEDVNNEIIKSNTIRKTKGRSVCTDDEVRLFWQMKFSRLFQLHLLKEEIKKLCADLNVVCFPILQDAVSWNYFRKLIVCVCADCPLEIKDEGCLLKYLVILSEEDMIKLEGGRKDGSPAEHLLDYIMVFKGGHKMHVSFLDCAIY